MAKTPAGKKPPTPVDPAPPDTRTVDLTTFKPDITLKDWTQMFKVGDLQIHAIFSTPIETLSCTKTVGLGRTNLTLKYPTLVQTDANPPYAAFNKQTTPPQQQCLVSVHFVPSAYGYTDPGTYYMAFSIDAYTQSTFSLSGYAGAGTLAGAGSRTVSGKQILTLIFKNLPPSQVVWGALEQTAGGAWSWYTTRISLPPILLSA
jgi:hypothetical protein